MKEVPYGFSVGYYCFGITFVKNETLSLSLNSISLQSI